MSAKNTVDVRHARKTEQFVRHRETRAELDEAIARLTSRRDELTDRRRSHGHLDDDQMSELIRVKDDIADLQKRRNEEVGDAEELRYMMDAGSVLFQYYDAVEKSGAHRSVVTHDEGTPSILRFFKMKAPSAAADTAASPSVSDAPSPPAPPAGNRAALLDQYMFATDPTYFDEANANAVVPAVCPHCKSTDRTLMPGDGHAICNECSALEFMLVDHDKPSYKEPPKEISHYAYKRVNHFNEWLSQIQGKESTVIDESVIDSILHELKKQKITNMMDVNVRKIREILKKIRHHKAYEHAPYILHRLNGKPVPHMSPELEDTLRNMFKMIQYPFLLHAPATRKNFLSYGYCLHKCIQLLGHDEFLPCFPLLKSRDKLFHQDQIWKKICEELGWEFVSSL